MHSTSPRVNSLALLALVGFFAGFLDAIAGGGGLVTVPALALAGLDPVAVVATNKLAGAFGSGSATLAFARAAPRAGARLARPLIVLVRCAMALRFASLPGAPSREWLEPVVRRALGG